MMMYRTRAQYGCLFRVGCTQTAAKSIAAALAGLVLSSCTVIKDPYVDPTPVSVSDELSFEDATKYAENKTRELNTKLKTLNTYEFVTGVLIVASGIVGAGMGAYGAHADAIIGAGLGAGAAYGARELVPIQDRKIIYGKGASAIRCAITEWALADLDGAIADTVEATEDVENSATAVQDAYLQLYHLQVAQRPSQQAESDPTGIADAYLLHLHANQASIQAQRARQRAENIVKRAKSLTDDAKSLKRHRATRLVSATDGILHVVNEQLTATRLDPDGAIKALRTDTQSFTSSIRDTYQQIVKIAEPGNEEREGAGEKASSAVVDANAQQQVQQPVAANPARAEPTANATTNAVNMAKEANRRVDAVASSAKRILEILNPESTCAAGL